MPLRVVVCHTGLEPQARVADFASPTVSSRQGPKQARVAEAGSQASLPLLLLTRAPLALVSQVAHPERGPDAARRGAAAALL